MLLLPNVLLTLAIKASVSPNTVRRRLEGLPMRPSTRARVEAAAKKMGVPLPRSVESKGRKNRASGRARRSP